MSASRHPGVDEYIDGMPDWQGDLARRVRKLIHEAEPGIEETIKRRVQPYFVLKGNVAALLTTKDHLNVFLYDGGLAPDPNGIINRGHGNETGRQIAIYQDDGLDGDAFKAIIAAIASNNRAGGWRKLKRS